MLTACRRKWFLIVGAACLAAFLCVLVPVLTGAVTGMDDAVYSAISPAINPAMTWVMRKISFFASLPFVCSALLALLLLPKTRRRFGFPLSIAMLSCAVINQLVKFLVAKERPGILILDVENGFSFPSGHSMAALVFYGLLLYFILRFVRHKNRQVLLSFLCIAVILLVGVSRIYLGVHFFSDVVGGFLLGGAVLFFFLYFYEKKLPA